MCVYKLDSYLRTRDYPNTHFIAQRHIKLIVLDVVYGFQLCYSEKNEQAEGEGEEEKISVPTVANRPPPDTQPDSTSEEDSGKIVFKRPVKRRRSSSEGILDASTKKTKEEGRGGKPRSRRRSSSSGVKNSSLLSFGDEEEV